MKKDKQDSYIQQKHSAVNQMSYRREKKDAKRRKTSENLEKSISTSFWVHAALEIW